jgi:BolA protein
MPTSHKTDIEHRLNQVFSPSFLNVTNESEKHRGHVNGPQGSERAETHFAVRMVSDQFNGLSRLDTHRLVFDVLADLMPKPIHALRLKLLGTDEDRF